MKTYKHSDGTTHWWPEFIPAGWKFYIKSDFSGQVWRRVRNEHVTE